MMYKQVKLKQQDKYQTVWLPEQFAHVGDYVCIKSKSYPESWDNWMVCEVYGSIRLDEDTINTYSQDYKHQRKASDI